MPYATKSDLPESVTSNLPVHAQEIYKAAYNSAWDEYHHDESRAHRVAWGAVKKEFHTNDDDTWVRGASTDESRSPIISGPIGYIRGC